MAICADFVLLGRAWASGLAAGDEAGVTAAIDLIRAELRISMGLTGVTDIAMLKEAGRSIIDRMEES
ncbi:alpha-hydroxy-acid oxidizing protein [Paracoccus sp. IB05]|uniref:alpha-hydroxy-acid oxidizing protein n=1 Tax=Paracoccus sp. IB05 TaxID=2779367 RepID=UPI0018E71B1B|nr:alpha-hydroxy-acid oxidizing protein [Paracoccus sp. IB05]MBJ2152187.1 alpha-hydroxy-acid oxidizing protein [Paracoccus sp. IB05]